MYIREADIADDVDLVCGMRLSFLADHRGLTPEALADDLVTKTREFVERKMRSGDLRSWLAEEQGSCRGIVSMLLLEMAPKPDEARSFEGYIINLYVPHDQRGQGFGNALFNACLKGAGTFGVRRLFLHATDAGRAIYHRSGFTPNDRWMELPL